MKITTAASVAATITAALVLAGCGTSDTTAGSATPPPASVPAAPSASGAVPAVHNDADIAFVQGMIPHHTQAVQMAQLAADRADNPRVKQLATRIEQAQGPEIAQMRGFLAAWGAPESGSMPGMGQGQMGQMNGMSGQQMQQLGQARGAAFDRMFLQMMIGHHTGAIEMARTELATGQNIEAKNLAQTIIDAQQAEITEMRQILAAV